VLVPVSAFVRCVLRNHDEVPRAGAHLEIATGTPVRLLTRDTPNVDARDERPERRGGVRHRERLRLVLGSAVLPRHQRDLALEL
jgi:hypothetical protein